MLGNRMGATGRIAARSPVLGTKPCLGPNFRLSLYDSFRSFATIRVSPAKNPPAKSAHSLLKIRPAALERLRQLTRDDGFLKIGVRSKGCSGSSYTLSYVPGKEPMDEVVTQDSVQVLIDGKALLSVIGSEVDFVEDELSSQFVFHNPNVKETCGCGLSFTTETPG